jgi:hypothetical protein
MLANWVVLCAEKFRLRYEQIKFSELSNLELHATDSPLSGTLGDWICQFHDKNSVKECSFPEMFSLFELFNIYIFSFRVKITHF